MRDLSLIPVLRRVPKQQLEAALVMTGHAPPRMELYSKFDLIDRIVHLLNALPVEDAAALWAALRR